MRCTVRAVWLCIAAPVFLRLRLKIRCGVTGAWRCNGVYGCSKPEFPSAAKDVFDRKLNGYHGFIIREDIEMRSLNSRSPFRFCTALSFLMATISTGCSLPCRNLTCHRNKPACEVYGVDYGPCHGYQKTCWRHWDNAACSNMCSPVAQDILADSESAATE